MADLTEIQATGVTKIIGSDASGLEQTPVQSTANGGLHINLRNNAGTEIGTTANPAIVAGPGVAGTPAGGVLSIQGVAGGTAVPTTASNFPTTVDTNYGVVGASTIRTASQIGNATGAALFGAGTTTAQVLRVVLPTDQTAIPATQSGTWTVKAQLQDNAGTAITLGQKVMASSIPVVISSDQSAIQIVGNIASGATDSGNPVKIGGPFNTTQPTVTNGQRVDAQFTNRGALIVATGIDPFNSRMFGVDSGAVQREVAVDTSGRLIVATGPIGGSNSGFAFGDVFTMANTQVAVRRTAYTEQTTNAQRSFNSSSAADAAAGTGARTIRLTYLDSTGAGPFTETITLNGTANVNTVSTTICFVEKIEVLTVGSGLSNAGIITMKAAAAGGGATIGTIAVGNNQTFWAHHYVPTGKIGYISGFSINSSAINISDSTLFVIKQASIGVANQVEKQVSDFHNLFGQNSGTNTRNYGSPIVVTGPVRLTVYATPASANQITHRASFDYSET